MEKPSNTYWRYKRILDLCSGSGAWSKPYRDSGNYIVERVEFKDGADVRLWEWDGKPVHGILMAPPCTHFSASGARWWKSKGDEPLLEGLSVVDACLRIAKITRPTWWVLENPVGRLNRYLGKPVEYFHPYEYGDPWKKKTALWGSFNMPEKKPVPHAKESAIYMLSPSEDRAALRSVTPSGFAKAFFEANQ